MPIGESGLKQNIADLNDVDATNRSNGKVIRWDETLGKHVYTDEQKVKADSTDTNADYLSGKVDNTTLEVDTTNHVLKVKDNVFASATHNHNLSDLQDVDTTGRTDGMAIIWDETNTKHIYGTINSTDEKVKSDSGDTTSGYLNDKVDGTTLEVDTTNHVLKVKDGVFVLTTDYEDQDVLNKIKNVDGTGSGLDADLLDGQEGSFYRNASNLNAGTVSRARLGALWYDNNASLADNPFIQSGLTGVGGGVGGTTVNFSYAYSNTPRVVLVAVTRDRRASVDNVTTTGFTFYTTDADGVNGWTAQVEWIAIGRKV